jgi:hypothetical protein
MSNFVEASFGRHRKFPEMEALKKIKAAEAVARIRQEQAQTLFAFARIWMGTPLLGGLSRGFSIKEKVREVTPALRQRAHTAPWRSK